MVGWLWWEDWLARLLEWGGERYSKMRASDISLRTGGRGGSGWCLDMWYRGSGVWVVDFFGKFVW